VSEKVGGWRVSYQHGGLAVMLYPPEGHPLLLSRDFLEEVLEHLKTRPVTDQDRRNMP